VFSREVKVLWIVRGIDATTGAERHTEIDAPTQKDAAIAARNAGILVTSMKQRAAEWTSLPDRAPSYEPDVLPSKTEGFPDYEAIVDSAEWLSVFAAMSAICGVAAVIAGVVMLVNCSEHPGFLGAGIGLIVGGLFYLGLSAILKMLRAMGLALRDIARGGRPRR
jgi:hypothetical protein